MASEQTSAGKPAVRPRFLLRGESVVAFTGIAVGVILLAATAASSWWILRTQRAAIAQARAEQVRSVGALLSQSAEVMLAGNEVSAVRRLVADAGRNYKLTRCRIVLPGNLVVADAEPSAITAGPVPASWDGAPPGGHEDAADETAVRLRYPLEVAGRGKAALHIDAEIEYPHGVYWEAQAGIGGIGAVALLGLLVVYRRMRRRLRAMGAIREALLAMAQGERSPHALAVSSALGPEAAAWNEIFAEREQLRKQASMERVRETLESRRLGRGGLDSACDVMSQGLILVDHGAQIKYANGAAATFLQARREELVGAEVGKFVRDEAVLEAVRTAAAGSASNRSVEVKAHGNGNASVLRFSVRPVRREDSASAMVVIEDITQQRVAEEARNAFVAQATHELRTPLTNIRLYVETAQDEGAGDPAVRANCINVINQEARRLERMVGDLLSVAEIEAGSMKVCKDDVRLDALFADLKADYAAQAQDKGITLTFDLPPKMPVIQGDADKIALVLHNLIGNGLKYTPAGGKVTVNLSQDNGELTVEVADTGIGMTPEDAGRVFEKFYRAQDRRVAKITGSGLGLAIAKEIARLHGGDITVESEVDKGSTFRLALPVASEG